MRRARKKQGGFTMIELMVTLVITMFALAGLLALNNTFSRGGQSASQTEEAVTVAKRALEELRVKRTADLSTSLTGSSNATPPFSRTSYETIAGRNGVSYTVDVAIDSVSTTLWRMRVLVSWTDDATGVTKQMPLELLRASSEAL